MTLAPEPMCRLSATEIDRALATAGENSPATLKAFDVHVHYLPPAYRDLVLRAGITKPDGFAGGVPVWSADDHLAHMERLGIETSVVSISTPGVVLDGPDSPATVARAANEGGAELVAAHPGKFGFYAALPVPDVDAALAELEYAADTLGAWGVCLLTNVEGCYLGDSVLEPVLAEISRRELPLLVHPTQPTVLVPDVMDGWSRSMYEYFFDTTRAITNLIFSGGLARHRGIKLIIPHAGSAIPALAQRIERNVWRANRGGTTPADELPSYVATLQQCWFDLAGSVLPYQLPSLLHLADETHIVYGSDYPFTGDVMGAELALDLRTTRQLTAHQKQQFLRQNALELFPQLEQTAGPS